MHRATIKYPLLHSELPTGVQNYFDQFRDEYEAVKRARRHALIWTTSVTLAILALTVLAAYLNNGPW